MNPPRMLLGVHGAGGGGWEWDRWRPVCAAAGWSLHTPDLQPAAEGIEATGFADYLQQLTTQLNGLQPETPIAFVVAGDRRFGSVRWHEGYVRHATRSLSERSLIEKLTLRVAYAATPLTYATVGYLKASERVDAYDDGTDFNPVRL